MSTATLTTPQATTTAPYVDQRRITEQDSDYQRLHVRTVRQLTASLRTFANDLRSGESVTQAQSAFIHRHVDLLRAAYIAAHEEGQRDYWQQVSATPTKQPIHEPDEQQLRRVLAFYAPSVAKMAQEAVTAMQAPPKAATTLSAPYTAIQLAEAEVQQWQDSLAPRVTLQADLTWAALNDGYVAGGANDGAAPYTSVWWQLGPVKTFHCSDCPALAAFSPYGRPGSGNNELYQTPGDGRTPCGAGCNCTLSYGFDLESYERLLDWRDSVFPPEIAGERDVPLQPAAPPQNPADMTQNQIRALDGFRAAQDQWLRANQETLARGNIINAYQQAQQALETATAQSGHSFPPLPNLFTAANQYRNEESLAALLRHWTMTDAQRIALTRAYDALVDWNDATAAVERTYEVGAGVADVESAEAINARQEDLARQVEDEMERYAAQNARPPVGPTIVRYDNEAAHMRITHVFPTDPTDEQIANLAGAPPGSTVDVDRTRFMTVNAPDGHISTTILYPKAVGEVGPQMMNFVYKAADESNTIAVDVEGLATQVQQAYALGIDSIHMKARSESEDFWRLPIYGYDTTMKSILDARESRSLVLPSGLEDAVMLSDVLATPEGRAWWLKNGLNPGLDFDPRPGSYSWITLDAYLRSLGLEGLQP